MSGPTGRRVGRTPSAAIAAGILALYLALSLVGITRPGIEHDEGKFLAGTLDIRDFGHLHAMTFEYVGALKEYLWLPWALVFEPDARVLRLPAVGIGLLALLLFYRLAARLLPPPYPLVALALLALDPGFVFETRYDTGPVALGFLLRGAVLLAFARFAQEGRAGDFGLGCLALGLGLWNKLTFGIFAIALAAGVAVAFPRATAGVLHRRAMVLAGAGLALLPVLPLVWFNVALPGVTLRELAGRSAEFAARQEPGVGERALGKLRLVDGGLTGLNLLADIRSGGLVFDDAWFRSFRVPAKWLAGSGGPTLPMTVLRASTLHLLLWVSLLTAVWTRSRAPPAMAAIAVATGLQYLALLVLPGAVFSHHVMWLLPLAPLLVAMALREWMVGLRSAGARRVVAAAIALHLALSLARGVHFATTVDAEGGRGWWSEASADLLAWIEARPGRCFVVMDWGIFPALQILSDNRVRLPEDLLWQLGLGPDPSPRERAAFLRRLARRSVDGTCHFLLHAPRYTRLPRARQRFEGLPLERLSVTVLPDRDGSPLFEIVEARVPPWRRAEGP